MPSALPNGKYRIVMIPPGNGPNPQPTFRPYWNAYKWLLKEKMPFQGHRSNVKIDVFAKKWPRHWWLISHLPDESQIKRDVINQIADYGSTADNTMSLLWVAADKLEAMSRLVGQVRGDWLVFEQEEGAVTVNVFEGQRA